MSNGTLRCDVIKNFSPSWFACVMGTGILAITSSFYSRYLSILKYVSYGLFYFNIVLFFILLIPWILRWILFREDSIRDLHHPIVSNFYATIAIGMLVLAADFITIGNNVLFGKIFWFPGMILTIFFGILTPYVAFRGEHVEIDHINPAWFIPPVGLIVIPIAGSVLMNQFSGLTKEIVTFINYFGWGAGFFLYLALHAISLYRFILHRPLPNVLAPTIWINLGPIGAGTVSLINLVKYSDFIQAKSPFFTFGFIFWGFGIWWFVMAVAMILHYMRNSKLPFALSWWAFTFPLGAYAAACHAVSTIFNIPLIDHIGFALYWLLFFIWFLTLRNTIKHAFCGTIFKSS